MATNLDFSFSGFHWSFFFPWFFSRVGQFFMIFSSFALFFWLNFLDLIGHIWHLWVFPLVASTYIAGWRKSHLGSLGQSNVTTTRAGQKSSVTKANSKSSSSLLGSTRYELYIQRVETRKDFFYKKNDIRHVGSTPDLSTLFFSTFLTNSWLIMRLLDPNIPPSQPKKWFFSWKNKMLRIT